MDFFVIITIIIFVNLKIKSKVKENGKKSAYANVVHKP